MNSKATVGMPLDEYFCISIKPKTKASLGNAFDWGFGFRFLQCRARLTLLPD